MRTLHNLLRVALIEPSTKTVGGIHLPEKSVEPRWATVLEVGPGVPDVTGFRLRPFCQPGDIIYMMPMAYNKCDLSGLFGERVETYFVSEGDVLLRMELKDNEPVLKPIGDWLVIEIVDPPEQRSAGGIIIPDTAKERPTFAKVVAVGEGARVPGAAVHLVLDALVGSLKHAISEDAFRVVSEAADRLKAELRQTVPPQVQPGDTVIIKNMSPIKLDLEPWGIRKKEYYLIPQGDCLAVVDQQSQGG